ncbi:hypothetical protein RAS1_10230 [Phycisphaerae bacterium RAS1]|nr:hypothetical protein RAS1_10230 [Phycisphaerae bacterium RAS1]
MPTLRRRHAVLLLVIVLTWGAWLRLASLADRPLWQDECWTAAAIRDSNAANLLRQTDLPIPPLFAVLAKCTHALAAPIERGVRLPAALFGCLTPFLIYRAARAAAASRSVALAAATLSASSIMLVVWSREAKHYGIEATFAAAAAWIIFAVRRGSPRARTCATAVLIGLVTVAPWFGYGVFFSLAPLLVLLFLPDARRRRTAVTIGIVTTAALAVSTVVLWSVAARGQSSNPALQSFWTERYIDAGNLRSWFDALSRLAMSSYLLALPSDWLREGDQALPGALLLAAAVAGLIFWPRRGRREMGVWFIAPLALMALAAAAHRYPFGVPRFFVVWSPAALILIAAGIVGLCRAAAKAALGDGRVGILAATIVCLLPATYVLNIPLRQAYWCYHDVPRVLRELAEKRKPGEKVFVSLVAGPAVAFYGPAGDLDFVDYPRTAGNIPVPGFDYAARTRDALAFAGRRFWIICISDRNDAILRGILSEAEKRGYSMEIVLQAGDRPALGNAVLLSMSR